MEGIKSQLYQIFMVILYCDKYLDNLMYIMSE
jgi:hypothetical protein